MKRRWGLLEDKQHRWREEMAALYRRNIKMVYQICLLMMKHIPDAEDAAQTVFRRAMEQKEAFRDSEHEKTWFIVTARNECKNRLKHWWRTCRVEEKMLDTLVWKQSEDRELWESILALPERYTFVILMGRYGLLSIVMF